MHIERRDKVFMRRLERSQTSLRLDIKDSNRLVVRRRNHVLTGRMQHHGADPIFVGIKDGHTRRRGHAPQTDRPITSTGYQIIHGIGILWSMLFGNGRPMIFRQKRQGFHDMFMTAQFDRHFFLVKDIDRFGRFGSQNF